MIKKSLLCFCFTALISPISVSALEISVPWVGPLQQKSANGLPALERPVHYPGARVLVSSQKLQQLSGMGTATQPGTLLSARLLAALSGAGNAVLPDGSSLGDYLSGWAQADIPDVTLYKVVYKSKNPAGGVTRLSGLVVIPDSVLSGADPSGILVYDHATTTQRNNAPSERPQEAYAMITAFAHPSIVIAMPDYLGYGVNKANHPYSMGELNAPSGRDMILATRELMKRLGRSVGSNLLITGYSEGGGNALWLTRYLESLNDGSLTPTLSSPMSGPYDLSGATALSFVGAQPPLTYQENFQSKPTLLSFAGVSTAKIIRQPLESLLLDPLAQQAKGNFTSDLSEGTLGVRLLTTSINDLGYVNYGTLTPNPENLLQPSLVTAIKTHDLQNPAMALWSENDNVNWTPASKVLLLGIVEDELVPYAASSYVLPLAWKPLNAAQAPYSSGNAQNVVAAMRKKGLGSDRVAWTGFLGATKSLTNPVVMSHADGILPCSILAYISFFNGKTKIPMLNDPPLQ